MRMRSLMLTAGAAAFAVASTPLPAQRGRPAAAPDWWFATYAGQAPQRSIIFIDRSTMRRSGGEASARTLQAFEQPRGDVRAFAMTYDYRCGVGHYRARDALFYTTANTQAPEGGVVDDWSPVVPGSVAASVLAAACNGRFDSAARRVAGAPMAEAARLFGERVSVAQAAPPTRAGPPGLMPRDQLVLCLSGRGPATPACQEARASAARGRATRMGNGPARTGGAAMASESFAQLLDRIVQADSEAWELNSYETGSMEIVDVQRDARGNVSMLRGNYRYGRGNPRYAGTILGGAHISTGSEAPWVEARFVNGRLQCLQYHDRSSCITSTRDYYEEGREAAREHYEYCAITRNC